MKSDFALSKTTVLAGRMGKETKTNAMRILESMKIPYTHMTYECDEFVDALQIADMLLLIFA